MSYNASLSRRRRSVVAFVLAFGSLACSDAAGPPRTSTRPVITHAFVAQNPHNTLSALIRFTTVNADSASLTYHATSDVGVNQATPEQSTPYFAIDGRAGVIPALALRENTQYDVTLHVRGGGVEIDTTLSYRAGQLPTELANLRLNPTRALDGGNVTTGYILTDFTGVNSAYVVVFDSTGRVCWYRQIAAQPGEVAIDASQQLNGDYTLFVGQSTGWQPTPGRFMEVNPGGDSVSTYLAADSYTDPHELILEYDGARVSHVDILGYDFKQVDLTALGGRPNQMVAGHAILRLSPTGKIEFTWSAWDHLKVADWIFIQPGLAQMPSIDFDHPNSLVIDSDDNYIVSFANLGEITKINSVTGEIVWRFGGRNNQFSLTGDPLNGFGIQHHAHVLPNGDLLLIDNGAHHSPPESRAVEYKLDLSAHTATMIWQYRHSPALFSPFAGSAQRLKNGNTIVAFGAAAMITEVEPSGNVIWEAQMQENGVKVQYFYHALRIGSLYQPAEM